VSRTQHRAELGACLGSSARERVSRSRNGVVEHMRLEEPRDGFFNLRTLFDQELGGTGRYLCLANAEILDAQARWVPVVERVSRAVTVGTAGERGDRFSGDELGGRRVVVAGPQVIEAALAVAVLAGVEQVGSAGLAEAPLSDEDHRYYHDNSHQPLPVPESPRTTHPFDPAQHHAR
jgi:hypothetical protein